MVGRDDLAMRGNRHSIYQLPFPSIAANFLDSAALIKVNPALQVSITDLDEQWHFGEIGLCHRLLLPKDRKARLYAAEVTLCISERTGLPLHIRSWDVEDGLRRQVEDYGYESVRVNGGAEGAGLRPGQSGV